MYRQQPMVPCPRRRMMVPRMLSAVLLLLLNLQGVSSTPWLPLVGGPPRPSLTAIGVSNVMTRSPSFSISRLERRTWDINDYTAKARVHGCGEGSPRLSLVGRIGAHGRLLARLLSDVVAAAMASLMVSPFISIVDRAIIQSANGSMTMSSSVRQGLSVMCTRPALFLARPDFLVTFGLYAATYLAANSISTLADEMARSDTWARFVCTTAINMPGSIAKDQALTKLFGVVGGAARVPAASFALFTVRDVATMAAAFTLPTPMSTKMQEDFGVARSWADGVSQLVSPGLVQFISTPVHILGLDLYNHPASSLSERFRVVQDTFVPAIVLRVTRIGVAFGVGCVGNNAIREKLHAAVVS